MVKGRAFDVEGLALSDEVAFVVHAQDDAAFEDVGELLALCRRHVKGTPARRQFKEDRLHHVFLRVRHDPLDRMVVLGINIEIGCSEHDAFVILVLEKLGQARPKRLEDIVERGDGRGYSSYLAVIISISS